MKKILIHNGGNRQYRSIVRYMNSVVSTTYQTQSANLHNNIFDTTYIYKPNILLFPFAEYTQEIHNFVEVNHNNIMIVLYMDIEVSDSRLLSYLQNTNCHYIVKNNSVNLNKNMISFDYLYDDSVYKIIPEIERNNKIAIGLSNNNEINQKILTQFLYPNLCQYELVLFNNPEFKHPQNIGIYNEPDLNYVLNSFSCFVDLDEDFALEAAATKIPWIGTKENFIEDIATTKLENNKFYQYDEYKASSFISEKMLPYLGI